MPQAIAQSSAHTAVMKLKSRKDVRIQSLRGALLPAACTPPGGETVVGSSGPAASFIRLLLLLLLALRAADASGADSVEGLPPAGARRGFGRAGVRWRRGATL
jgi:hypothetical protein